MRLLFGLAALLTASATHAQFIDFAKAPPANIGLVSEAHGSYPAVILFEGIIGLTDPARLLDLVVAKHLEDGRAIVYFRSPGGLSECAIDIGRFIRRHQFDTAVEGRKFCNSACATAWLGGVRRFLGQDAHVGFHSTQDMLSDGTKQRSVYGNKRVATYLVGLGYPEALGDYVTAPAPSTMTYLSQNGARDADMYRIIDPRPFWEIGVINRPVGSAQSAELPTPLESPFRPFSRINIVPTPVPVTVPASRP